MGLSIWHLLIVLAIIFVVFGAGKLPRVMGDVGKGVRNLRDGLKGEDDESKAAKAITPDPDATIIEHEPVAKAKSGKKQG